MAEGRGSATALGWSALPPEGLQLPAAHSGFVRDLSKGAATRNT